MALMSVCCWHLLTQANFILSLLNNKTMKEKLIPIIASYIGSCKVRQSVMGLDLADKTLDISNVGYFTHKDAQGSKLLLRRLWDITEDELKELCKSIGERDKDILIAINRTWPTWNYIRVYSMGTLIIEIGNWGDILDSLRIQHSNPVDIINFLRSKGFCVDRELVENNLVEFIKP